MAVHQVRPGCVLKWCFGSLEAGRSLEAKLGVFLSALNCVSRREAGLPWATGRVSVVLEWAIGCLLRERLHVLLSLRRKGG